MIHAPESKDLQTREKALRSLETCRIALNANNNTEEIIKAVTTFFDDQLYPYLELVQTKKIPKDDDYNRILNCCAVFLTPKIIHVLPFDNYQWPVSINLFFSLNFYPLLDTDLVNVALKYADFIDRYYPDTNEKESLVWNTLTAFKLYRASMTGTRDPNIMGSVQDLFNNFVDSSTTSKLRNNWSRVTYALNTINAIDGYTLRKFGDEIIVNLREDINYCRTVTAIGKHCQFESRTEVKADEYKKCLLGLYLHYFGPCLLYIFDKNGKKEETYLHDALRYIRSSLDSTFRGVESVKEPYRFPFDNTPIETYSKTFHSYMYSWNIVKILNQ